MDISLFLSGEVGSFSSDEVDSFSSDEVDSFSSDEVGSFSSDEVDSFSSDEVGSFSTTIESLDNYSLPTLAVSQLQSGDTDISHEAPNEISLLTNVSSNVSSTSPGPCNLQVHQPVSLNAGYKLVFDNINWYIKPRYMRLDSQATSLSYVQSYGVKDRIDYSSISSTEVNLYDVLPTSNDYESLKKDFTILISRMIIDYLPFFSKDFKNLVKRHIPHKYSREMCKKSKVVSVTVSRVV